MKTFKPKVEKLDFKKTIINAKSPATVKKVDRDKLLKEDLKVIDFKKIEQEKKSVGSNKLDQVKKPNPQPKTKKANLASSKVIKQLNPVVKSNTVKSNVVKSSKTTKATKKPNQSNFKDNNIATKQNIRKSSSMSKKPNSIGKNKTLDQWYSSSQTIQKSSFWDKIVNVTKAIINCFNIARLVKRGW